MERSIAGLMSSLSIPMATPKAEDRSDKAALVVHVVVVLIVPCLRAIVRAIRSTL